MFTHEYWEMAQKKGWLVKRTDTDSYLKDPKKWKKMDETLLEHINSLGINSEEKIYLEKLHSDNKSKFANMIIDLNDEQKISSLTNFKDLIDQISKILIS